MEKSKGDEMKIFQCGCRPSFAKSPQLENSSVFANLKIPCCKLDNGMMEEIFEIDSNPKKVNLMGEGYENLFISGVPFVFPVIYRAESGISMSMARGTPVDPEPSKIDFEDNAYDDDYKYYKELDRDASFEQIEELEPFEFKGKIDVTFPYPLLVQINHDYTTPGGLPQFTNLATRLILGSDCSIYPDVRSLAFQTIGACGAFRLAAMFLSKIMNLKTVYVSNPPNEQYKLNMISGSLKRFRYYRYVNERLNFLDFQGMVEDLNCASKDSAVVFQMSGHFPSGLDLKREYWRSLANIVKKKRLFPIFDATFHGIARGDLDDESWPVRHFAEKGIEFIVIQSFSLNFSLGGDRLGNLILVVDKSANVEDLSMHMSLLIREMYTTPPSHGAEIVRHILNYRELTFQWANELLEFVKQINCIRNQLAYQLKKRKVMWQPNIGLWVPLLMQQGLFVNFGLNEKQIHNLRTESSIYVSDSGVMNLSGLTRRTIRWIGKAMTKMILAHPFPLQPEFAIGKASVYMTDEEIRQLQIVSDIFHTESAISLSSHLEVTSDNSETPSQSAQRPDSQILVGMCAKWIQFLQDIKQLSPEEAESEVIDYIKRNYGKEVRALGSINGPCLNPQEVLEVIRIRRLIRNENFFIPTPVRLENFKIPEVEGETSEELSLKVIKSPPKNVEVSSDDECYLDENEQEVYTLYHANSFLEGYEEFYEEMGSESDSPCSSRISKIFLLDRDRIESETKVKVNSPSPLLQTEDKGIKTETSVTETVNTEMSKFIGSGTETFRTESARVEPSRTETFATESTDRSGGGRFALVARSDSFRTDTSKTDSERVETSRPKSAKIEKSRIDSLAMDMKKTDSLAVGITKTEVVRSETAKTSAKSPNSRVSRPATINLKQETRIRFNYDADYSEISEDELNL